MIAYNNQWLDNLYIREEALDAFHQNCLEKDELDAVNANYPASFYSPNIFIRIGLFILTCVIFLFTFGLFALFFGNSSDNAFGSLAIFFALISYAALEFIVRSKNHLQSGVDDALVWISAGSLLGGISFLTHAGDLGNCLIVFIISAYFCLRFADRVMALVLYISLTGIIFFTLINRGIAARAVIPFVLMAISGIIYFAVKRIKQINTNQLYSSCLQVLSVAALLCFYIAGNYYVVRELTNAMFDMNLTQSQSVPFGWLFWLFTFAVPMLYIARGIQKKDIVLIRVGLLLVGAIVFTVRYYYAVASIEVIMTTGGIALVIVSYSLSRYFVIPRFGFTNVQPASNEKEKLNIESILVAQTISTQPAATDGTRFGGGSFGGGGSSGEF